MAAAKPCNHLLLLSLWRRGWEPSFGPILLKPLVFLWADMLRAPTNDLCFRVNRSNLGQDPTAVELATIGILPASTTTTDGVPSRTASSITASNAASSRGCA